MARKGKQLKVWLDEELMGELMLESGVSKKTVSEIVRVAIANRHKAQAYQAIQDATRALQMVVDCEKRASLGDAWGELCSDGLIAEAEVAFEIASEELAEAGFQARPDELARIAQYNFVEQQITELCSMGGK